jgi:pimeloyl-ACP methyl ester carboxylesterase
MRWVGLALAVVLAAGLAVGCGSKSGGALGAGTTGASTASTSSVPSSAPAAPGLDVVPLIIAHGIDGEPAELFPLCDLLGQGRTVLREVYVDDTAALATNSLPQDLVVNFGYYKTSSTGAAYDQHGSIGGCPVPRSDGLDVSYYTTSYARRFAQCVADVKRATGAPKVDIVLHSMGGLVGRAFTRWLSVDPSGASSVRRIFLIASPSRGINALECASLAIAHTGSETFMREGECLELCGEDSEWSGESYIAALDDDWDGFCAQHGIQYAGLSATGAQGTPGGSSGSVIPGSGLPVGPILQFLQGALNWTGMGSILPVIWTAITNLPSEITVALGPSDGTVRLASSRLDEAPFLATVFWGTFEGAHSGLINVEQTSYGSTYCAECVRAFCLEAAEPTTSSCTQLAVKPVFAPGHATWIEADVTVAGVPGNNSPLAIQLVESSLDSTGAVTTNWSYGAALVNGSQTLQFAVPSGGGTRTYRAVVYGEHGEIAVQEGPTVDCQSGVVDPAPEAAIQAFPGPSAAHLVFSANGPAPLYSVRFDRGAWSAWTDTATFDTPPLLPGAHRVEVRVEHAGNGAGVLAQSAHAAAVGLLVDASGNVTVVP